MQTALRFGWSKPHEELHVTLRPQDAAAAGRRLHSAVCRRLHPVPAWAKHDAREAVEMNTPGRDLTELSAGGGTRATMMTAQREVSSLTGASGSACDSAGSEERDSPRLGEPLLRGSPCCTGDWKDEDACQADAQERRQNRTCQSQEPANVAEEAERRLPSVLQESSRR